MNQLWIIIVMFCNVICILKLFCIPWYYKLANRLGIMHHIFIINPVLRKWKESYNFAKTNTGLAEFGSVISPLQSYHIKSKVYLNQRTCKAFKLIIIHIRINTVALKLFLLVTLKNLQHVLLSKENKTFINIAQSQKSVNCNLLFFFCACIQGNYYISNSRTRYFIFSHKT